MALKWYGKAGSSMQDKNFRYKNTTRQGNAGEKRIEALLKRVVDNDTIGFSSVLTPSEKYRSDIDFVLIKGNRVLLVDAKLYKQGGFYWSMNNILWRNFRKSFGDKPMSRNMSMARDMVQRKLGPDYKVDAIVAFAKSHDNSPATNTFFAKWDGGIKSVNESGLVSKVNSFFRGTKNNTNLTAAAEKFFASLTQ